MVRSVPEGHMVVWMTSYVEGMGVRKDALVTIRRWIQEKDLLTGGNLQPGQFDIGCDVPRLALDW